MQIGLEIARFMAGPVLTTLGTRDAAGRPMIARGSGVWATGGRDLVCVTISAWLWPETLANLRHNGMLALTVVQPTDYRAFQMKGRVAIRPATAVEAGRAERYVEATRAFLIGLGVPPEISEYWLCARDVAMAELVVDQVFEQTPGPRAGAVVA